MSRVATTKLHLKPSEKDLFDYRAFDPASIRPMSPADDVDRRTSLVGEDSARFDWSEQSLSSWMKFAVAVSSILGVLYVVWLAEWGPQWGEAFTTNVEALAGGNSTIAITLMMLFFAICHSGLASLRPAGEDLVGPRVWRYLFAMVSLPLAYSSIGYFVEHRYVSLTLFVTLYLLLMVCGYNRNDGVRLWDLRSEPWMRPAVFAASVLSFLFLYPSTFNLLEVAAVDEPKLHLWETGIARITRHPQTVGQILWCAAHTAYIGTSFACAASAVLCGTLLHLSVSSLLRVLTAFVSMCVHRAPRFLRVERRPAAARQVRRPGGPPPRAHLRRALRRDPLGETAAPAQLLAR